VPDKQWLCLHVHAGVTDDAVLARSNVKPHHVLDSFGDLLAIKDAVHAQQSDAAPA
jgi:hypothetical protein